MDFLTAVTGTEATPTTPPATGVEAHERMAAALYSRTAPTDKAPANIVEMRKAAGEDFYSKGRLNEYGPTKKGDQVGILDTSANVIDRLVVAVNPAASNAQLVDQAAQLGPMAADVGFTKLDIEQLTSFAAQNQTKPPTAEEMRAHQYTALRELRETYGPGFDDALRDAKALVARDPRLKQFLESAKLGSHPAVVLRLAELGRAERARGRLK